MRANLPGYNYPQGVYQTKLIAMCMYCFLYSMTHQRSHMRLGQVLISSSSRLMESTVQYLLDGDEFQISAQVWHRTCGSTENQERQASLSKLFSIIMESEQERCLPRSL
jgi:hypothetical protein